jgi:hypothetical protein
LSEVEIELHQLALWTILCSRWPKLADYLVEHPEILEKIGQPGSTGFPEDLKTLSGEPTLARVVKGDSVQTSLSAETLKQCARIRS